MMRTVISTEPFGSIFPECVPLAERHYAEVGDSDPLRPLIVDADQMHSLSLSGLMIIVTARANSDLIGYFTWSIYNDPESRGLRSADQGAWYLAPGHWRVARRMFDRSVAELRLLGVKMIYPHHRLTGRGEGLAKEFLRRGAEPEKQVYKLWIGDAVGQH